MKNSHKRKGVRIIYSIVLGLILLQVILALLAAPLLEIWLADEVKARSKGTFALKRIELSLHPSTSRIHLSEVLLESTDTLQEAFYLEIPQAELHFPRIRKWMRSGQLVLPYIRLRRPTLALKSTPRPRKSSMPLTPQRLFAQLDSLFQGSFRGIEIQQLELRDGTFRYGDQETFSQPFEARDVSLTLRDFKSTKALVQNRIPFTVKEASFAMDAQNYRFALGDSSYVLTLDKLGISTREGRWTGEGLRLMSREEQGWRIDIPLLQLDQMEILQALQKGELGIGSLRIQATSLVQVPGGPKPQAPDWQKIWTQMRPWLRKIQVEAISIDGANYRQKDYWEAKTDKIWIQDAGLFLQAFKVDSVALMRRTDVFFAKGAEVQIDSFAFQLSEGNYDLKGASAGFSTYNGSLDIGAFALAPKASSFALARQTGREVISLDIPGIKLRGIHTALLWQSDKLKLDSLIVQQPAIRLTNYPKVNRKAVAEFTQKNLHDRIAPFLQSLEIDLLRVKQGTFTWNQPLSLQTEQLRAKSLNIDIQGFQLNDSAHFQSERPFYAQDIRVSVDIPSYSYILPDSSYSIQAQGIGLRTADASLSLDSLRLTPLEKNLHNTNLTITLPKVQIKGIDAYQAYFFQAYQADSLIFDRAHCAIVQADSSSPSAPSVLPIRLDTLQPANWLVGWAKSLSFGYIGIRAGQLELLSADKKIPPWGRVEGIDLGVSQFRLDSSSQISPERFLLSDQVSLMLPAGSITLPDSQHQFQWQSIAADLQRGNVRLQGGKLSPRVDEDFSRYPQHYAIDIPELAISGIGIYDWLVKRQLRIKKMALPQPRFVIVNLPTVDSAAIDSIIQSNLYDLIANELEGFYLDEAQIIDAALQINNLSQRGKMAFKAQHGLLWIQGFRIDSATVAAEKQFEVDKFDFSLDMSGYSLQTPDSSYAVEIGEIVISTVDSSLEARKVLIKPIQSQAQVNSGYLTGRIPAIRVSGIDPLEIYQNRRLHLGMLRLSRPDIQFIPPTLSDPQADSSDWYTTIHKVFKEVSVRELRIDSAQLKMQNGPKVKQISFRLDKFVLDSLPLIRPQKTFYAQNWNLHLQQWQGQSTDSLYGFTLGRAKRLPNKAGWILENLRIHSLPEQEAFFAKNGYARDSLEVVLHKVKVPSLNLYQFQTDSVLDWRAVEIDSFTIHIWKNRQWPRNPAKRPPDLLEALAKVPFQIQIDSLIARKGYLFYAEKGQFPGQQGYLSLDSLYARLYTIDNRPAAQWTGKSPVLTLLAGGRLMDTAYFSAEYRYPLADTGSYAYSGKVSGMRLEKLNPVLESAAAIRVTKGYLQKMRFQGQANQRRSRGRMWMHYRDLQVAVIEPVDGLEQQGRKKRFMSAIANSVVVRTNNPKRRFIRVGRIQYQLEPDKSFVGHWVQALLTGVKSSVGLTQKEDKDKSLGRRTDQKNRKRSAGQK